MAMTSSSAPSWQVDIAGLSQLILNVGSHGLKQLAMAGVDIHSIGCMLMIAEFTPASREFRKKITNARQAQRSERLWLYKVVEIGASTNFLADQLLKTRAGENVLALLAATVPVMDEEMCTTALIALFEGANVSLDNIPGINQLRAIRTDLAPLSRKVGFGEKVLNYHKFLWSLHGNKNFQVMPEASPYSAIPLATDIATIVRTLHKIVSSEDDYIFISWGLRGAAWITAYASEVLGLRVCALQADRTPVPVTGAYDDAKVLIELASDQSKCGMYLNRDLQEQYQLQVADTEKRRGWSVDLTTVHFLEYRHPKITKSESLARLSAFTALETLNRVSTLCTGISSWNKNRMALESSENGSGFVGYAESELHQIQGRSLRILRQLGFQPGTLDHYKFAASKERPTYIATGHESDFPVLEILTNEEYFDYDLGKKRMRRYQSRFGQYSVEGSISGKGTVDRICYFLADPKVYSDHSEENLPQGKIMTFESGFLEWRRDLQRAFAETVRIASQFASYLAFSDWDVSLRQMSVSFLRYGEEKEYEAESGYFEANMSTAITFCADNLDMSTLENKLWSADWIALDLDGLIVHRNTARYHSIHDLRGKFLGLTAGRIMFEGDTCSKVRSDRVGVNYQSWGTQVAGGKIQDCAPKLSFSDLSVRTLLSSVKDTLFVRLEGFRGSDIAFVGDASKVGRILPDALVTTPCRHGYRSVPAVIHASPSINVMQGLVFKAADGLQFRHDQIHVYYQLVDNSALGQWLACHWTSDNERSLTIFQRDCCFHCVLRRLQQLYHVIENSGHPLDADGLDVCVIAGGMDERRLQVRQQRAVSSASRESTSRPRADSSRSTQGPSSEYLRPPGQPDQYAGPKPARSSDDLLRPRDHDVNAASHRRAVSSGSVKRKPVPSERLRRNS